MDATLFLGAVVVTNTAYAVELRKRGFGARPLQMGGPDSVAAQLLLLDEEAFYLVSHGSLMVKSEGRPVGKEQLWSTLFDKDASFPNKYIVYKHFKDKGYIVKTGVNFGVDYCVYDRLPSECHSETCVTVIDGWGGCTTAVSGSRDLSGGVLSWRHITTLTRAMPDVMKLCVVCYVLPVGAIPVVKPVQPPGTAVASTPVADDSAMSADLTDSTIQDNDSINGNITSAGYSIDSTGQHGDIAVSPYLSLFPHLHPGAQPSSIPLQIAEQEMAVTETPLAIDPSTPDCLQQLRVHSVTALVRRQPAVASTYQSIAQIQAQYRSASTAQKSAGSKVGGAQNRQRKQGSKSQHSTGKARERLEGSEAVDGRMDIADADGAAGDNKPLSARQQRVAKYLLKAQTALAGVQQQRDGPRRNQGSLDKDRRDHREVRTKTMSNKNQSLLDALGAAVGQPVAQGQSANSSGSGASKSGGETHMGLEIAQTDYAGEARGIASGDVEQPAAEALLGHKRPLAAELPPYVSGKTEEDGDRKRHRGETDASSRIGWGGWFGGMSTDSGGEGTPQGWVSWVNSCTIS